MRRARARTSIVGAALAIVVVASLIAGEVALRVAARLNGTIARAVAAPDSGPAPVLLLPDEKLIFRGNPVYPGHDPRGYRNARPLSRADIVALGDSQTYGLSVGVDEAWPVLLGRLTRQIVYNMALPSYGPGQYVMQIDDALLLHPQQVIVAVYLGNDFFDTYLMAKRHSAALGTAVSAELRNSAKWRIRWSPSSSACG